MRECLAIVGSKAHRPKVGFCNALKGNTADAALLAYHGVLTQNVLVEMGAVNRRCNLWSAGCSEPPRSVDA